MSFEIRRATIDDVKTVAVLFDAYRQFYYKPADLALAESFIGERLARNESVIFLAFDALDKAAIGFTQLYPTFSSGACRTMWILNDLFVDQRARKRGVGRALLETASNHASSTKAKRLALMTETTNRTAQALYESFGFKQDETFLAYTFELE